MLLLKIMEWNEGKKNGEINEETKKLVLGVIYHQKKGVLNAVNTALDF